MSIRILHVITALGVGGAERVLCDVSQGLQTRGFAQSVVSLTEGGVTAATVQCSGIRVDALGLGRGRPRGAAFLGLLKRIREFEPDVVQSWLYHADLLAALAAAIARPVAVAWNIRCSEMDLRHYGPSTRFAVWASARLSGVVAAVVVNSRAGRLEHERMGYHPKRWVHIPNGVRADVFRPSIEARHSVREELGIAAETPLIGMLARFDPMKDHATFLTAAGSLSRTRPDVHFLLAGEGVSAAETSILREIEHKGLSGRVHLLGPRSDAARLLAALDLYAMTSRFGEGFPNSVAEALSCGIPCAVTDVGDAAWIVGDAGRVVPAGVPVAMASAWADLLDVDAETLNAIAVGARRRVLTDFSFEACVGRYEALYRELAEDAQCAA